MPRPLPRPLLPAETVLKILGHSEDNLGHSEDNLGHSEDNLAKTTATDYQHQHHPDRHEQVDDHSSPIDHREAIMAVEEINGAEKSDHGGKISDPPNVIVKSKLLLSAPLSKPRQQSSRIIATLDRLSYELSGVYGRGSSNSKLEQERQKPDPEVEVEAEAVAKDELHEVDDMKSMARVEAVAEEPQEVDTMKSMARAEKSGLVGVGARIPAMDDIGDGVECAGPGNSRLLDEKKPVAPGDVPIDEHRMDVPMEHRMDESEAAQPEAKVQAQAQPEATPSIDSVEQPKSPEQATSTTKFQAKETEQTGDIANSGQPDGRAHGPDTAEPSKDSTPVPDVLNSSAADPLDATKSVSELFEDFRDHDETSAIPQETDVAGITEKDAEKHTVAAKLVPDGSKLCDRKAPGSGRIVDHLQTSSTHLDTKKGLPQSAQPRSLKDSNSDSKPDSDSALKHTEATVLVDEKGTFDEKLDDGEILLDDEDFLGADGHRKSLTADGSPPDHKSSSKTHLDSTLTTKTKSVSDEKSEPKSVFDEKSQPESVPDEKLDPQRISEALFVKCCLRSSASAPSESLASDTDTDMDPSRPTSDNTSSSTTDVQDFDEQQPDDRKGVSGGKTDETDDEDDDEDMSTAADLASSSNTLFVSFWEKLIAGLKCSQRDCDAAFRTGGGPALKRRLVEPSIIRRARTHHSNDDGHQQGRICS